MGTPWYIPETGRQAADCIENVASIIAFLKDTLAQEARYTFRFSEDGDTGLFCILDVMEDALKRCDEILVKEVR